MKSQRTLWIVLLAIFLDLASYSILIPIVPQLLANPHSTYYLLSPSVSLAHGYILLGFLIALYPIIQFFSTPILGELSDRYGRRPILLITLLGTSASLAVFGWGVAVGSLTLLFVSRAVGGIVGGNVSVAQAVIADITPSAKRLTYFGLVGAAYGVGLILGPVMGALLSDPHIVSWFVPATPFWFATILSIINLVLILLYLKETHTPGVARNISWNGAIKHIIHAYGMKKLRAIFAVNFLFQMAITFFTTFFSVFLIARFSMDQSAIGYYIGFAGIWVILSQAVVIRFLGRMVQDITLLRLSLFFGAAAIFLYYIPTTLIGVYTVGAIFALINGISMATLPSLVSRKAPPDMQGEILGINASVQALAQTAPPILSGFLAAQIAPVAPVYISGAIVGLAWIVCVVFVKRD